VRITLSIETTMRTKQLRATLDSCELLYNYAFWMLGSEEAASRLLVEVYSRVTRQLSQNLTTLELRVKLFQLMRSLITARPADRAPGESGEPTVTSETPPNPDEQKYPEGILKFLIKMLPEHLSTILILSDVLELTYDQIRELLQCTAETVSVHLHGARLMLRTELVHYAEVHGILTEGSSSSDGQLMELGSQFATERISHGKQGPSSLGNNTGGR
jgi:DNA-directed RNA polymerase specialized sigma24 family protein